MEGRQGVRNRDHYGVAGGLQGSSSGQWRVTRESRTVITMGSPEVYKGSMEGHQGVTNRDHYGAYWYTFVRV